MEFIIVLVRRNAIVTYLGLYSEELNSWKMVPETRAIKSSISGDSVDGVASIWSDVRYGTFDGAFPEIFSKNYAPQSIHKLPHSSSDILSELHYITPLYFQKDLQTYPIQKVFLNMFR